MENNNLYAKLMDGFRTEIGKLKDDQKRENEEYKQEVREQNNKILQKLDNQSQNQAKLESKCEKLEKRNLQFERLHRKNNVIIHGIELDESADIVNVTLRKLNTFLESDLKSSDINNLYKLKSDNNSPIKIEFISYLRKSEVMKLGYKLKGTHIFIVHDICPEDRSQYKILRKHLKLAKSKNIPSKIINFKLLVNGELFSAEQLEEEEEQTQVVIERTQNTPQKIPKPRSLPSTPSVDVQESRDLFFSEETELTVNQTPQTEGVQPPAKKKAGTRNTSSSTANKTKIGSPSVRVTRNKIGEKEKLQQ